MNGYDVIVVGTGAAGLSVALGLAATRRVAVITDGDLGGGSTPWAQGGVAAAIDRGDSPRLHALDTMVAGAGGCDDDIVRVVTEEAPQRLAELIDLGAIFDRDDTGRLSLTREGGHHRRRVAHAGGDATGAEVSRALVAAVRRSTVTIIDHTTVVDVERAISHGRAQVTGVTVRRTDVAGDSTELIAARAVVLATGGVGGIYRASTNPAEVTGDGLAIALRAGASLTDLEFVQFHPTALATASTVGQIPLITEALRGEGAVLRDVQGDPIMAGHHPMGDLAPRDIVARRIAEVMAAEGGGGQVVLDATRFSPDLLRNRFPTVFAACTQHGIDPTIEPIPVAPAQHFLCGGIRTDRWGATDVVGLFAAGEVAATGLHGANRLASNSLVEGMVLGRRIAARLSRELPLLAAASAPISVPIPWVGEASIADIRATMTRHVGVHRSAAGLDAAAASLASMASGVDLQPSPSRGAANRWTVAMAVLAGATARRESRGCHWRADFRNSLDDWRRHVVVRLNADGVPVAALDTPMERSA